MRRNILFILLGIIFSISFISASFNVGNYSITTSYSKGDFLKGNVEMNFSGELLNSKFTDNFGNSVELGELINVSNYTYTCTPTDCSSYYNASNLQSTKTFQLNANSSKILGFKLTGNIDTIQKIEFTFDSDAGQAETNQLKMDILNDGSYETGNSAVGTLTFSEKDFGCFSSAEVVEEASIDTIPYCQQVTLREAPAFLIGGEFKVKTTGTQNLTMELYNKDGLFLQKCTIPKEQITPVFSQVSCQVNYLVPEEDEYYVCVKATSGTGEYKTKAYASNDPSLNCGFKGEPVDSFVGAYRLYASGKYFGAVPETKINDTLPNGNSLIVMVEDYFLEKYGGMDCTAGCFIPIKFLSSVNQTITIKDIYVLYDKVGISGAELTGISDFSENPPLISSSIQKLYLDTYFNLPDDTKEYTYKLKFNDKEVFEEIISIENVSLKLSPLKTARGFPTVFNVTGFSGVSYYWNFGDNSTEMSSTNSITHTYSAINNYTVSIRAISSGGNEFSKSFKVVVESPKTLIDSELSSYESILNSLKTQISKYDTFTKTILTQELKMTENELKVKELKINAGLAQSQEDYDAIIEELLNFNIPTTIFQSSTARVPFYVQKEYIDLNSLAEVSESFVTEGREDDLNNLLIFWNQEKLDVKVSIKNYFVKKEGEDFLKENIYEMIFTKKDSSMTPYYVIFEDLDGLVIDNPNVINLSTGYKAIVLDSDTVILFSLPDVTLSELPVFFAPSISELNLEDTNAIDVEASKKKILYLYLSLFGLVLLGFFVYYLLHRWYKIKYEKYLFKDRNNLYNVMIYVNNSKKQGLSNDQIRENLRKSGWNAEQIRYIMRKFHGRETGLPLFGSSKLPSTTTEEKNPVKISTQNLQNKTGLGYKP